MGENLARFFCVLPGGKGDFDGVCLVVRARIRALVRRADVILGR